MKEKCTIIIVLFGNSGYGTKAIESVQKPKTFEYDGSAGISNFITGKSGFGFPNTIVLAATWNQELANEYGKLMGEDAILTKTAGWYAPATNLHRSPFSGRNYEYFSEDPFQSGRITANIIKNIQNKGVYVYMKHFALNDQETNRSANNQVSVWAQEQTIRELYLKPFQMGVEDGGAKGIMLSMNRIGSTWSGDHSPLLTNVTRGEWGFKGIFITDYLARMDPIMIDKLLAAGANLVLSTSEFRLTDVKANWCRAYLRDSTHLVLYHQANSLAVNGLGAENVKFEVGTPIYKIALWVLMGLLAIYLVYSVLKMISVWPHERSAVRRQPSAHRQSTPDQEHCSGRSAGCSDRLPADYLPPRAAKGIHYLTQKEPASCLKTEAGSFCVPAGQTDFPVLPVSSGCKFRMHSRKAVLRHAFRSAR
ncbi:MAG: hypothetical protein K6A68_09335 [Clostridiales bacterium]|nr:hypothetical protein [Clostridiales bacterium]